MQIILPSTALFNVTAQVCIYSTQVIEKPFVNNTLAVKPTFATALIAEINNITKERNLVQSTVNQFSSEPHYVSFIMLRTLLPCPEGRELKGHPLVNKIYI